MNRFRVNLHPALFKENTPEQRDHTTEEIERAEALDGFKKEERILEENIRRNNEALASGVEKADQATDKELAKQLKQLAKNKKIDFPWTDNEWKCSRAEKKLATSSAKVFQQLLEKGKLQDMINKCKSQQGDLTKEVAEQWGNDFGINSKAKDILNFYKAFKEYQNPQSEYQHLKNLMGFFCESNFENRDDLVSSMQTRSEKISKRNVRARGNAMYHTEWDAGSGRYVTLDTQAQEEIDRKPKDWKQRASFEIIKERLENNKNTTDKMLTLLGDFNLDGEVNSGDVGYKTGSQFVDVFRRTVATNHLKDAKFDDNKTVENLVAYAKRSGLDIGEIKTVEELYGWMTNEKGYDNTKSLQNFLRNLPIELSDILSNGEKAGSESLANITSALKLEETEKETLEKVATEKAKEIVSTGEARLKEVIKDDRERADVAQQLLDQLPSMLISKAAEQQMGLAAGVAVPLDQVIKGMSGGFDVGIGSDGKPAFGLFLGWDRKFNLSDRTQLETAVTAGNKLLFIPFGAASMEIGIDTNKGRRNKSLDAKGEHRITLGGNVAITGGIFSYGFSAGYENNKQVGIEKQAQNINKVVNKQAEVWVKALAELKPIGNSKEVTFAQKRGALENVLKGEFPKSSDEELTSAANNLLSIIQGFKIDEKTSEDDFKTYAQVIADVYSEQWRNAALAGIADNKRKISGGKVGIQFIAGCIPVVSLVARFTKYRNARTNETEHSRVARIDAQFNGQGNEQLSLGDSKEIGAEKVAQINEVLKRYGAKSELQYIPGVDGKPGRIQVPVSIADGIGINVRVSENLKGCVGQTTEKHIGGEVFYDFPANATYRLLQETGGNQRSVTLNIGSDKSSTSDILLADSEKMGELIGDKELVAGKKLEYNTTFVGKGSVEYNPDFIDSLFPADVVEGLKTIDSLHRGKFSTFMKNKTDADANFEEMIRALSNVLGKKDIYRGILVKLKSEDVSPADKQLIMDKILAISAEANVHDKNGLDVNVSQRGETYKKLEMRGANGQAIFKELKGKDYRADVIKKIHDDKNYDPVKSNILGATAFYNRNNSSKGLAFTGLGATKVLGGKFSELTSEDSNKVKNWFLGYQNEGGKNVPGVLGEEKSPAEWSNLKIGVSKYIKDQIGEFKNEQLNSLLTNVQLKDLLEGKNIELKLDNSDKKVKINLDVKYVFYLMGECANESVGMKLGDLQVQEQHEVDDYRQGELYLNSSDGASSVSVSGKGFAVGMSFGGKKGNENQGSMPGDGPTGGDDPDYKSNLDF